MYVVIIPMALDTNFLFTSIFKFPGSEGAMLFTSEWNPGNFSGEELHEIRIEVVPEVGVPETAVRRFCLGRCHGFEALEWLPW